MQERETTAAAARTDAGSGGAEHPEAHPTGTALASAAGGLVGGERASRGEGTYGAGHTPAQTPAATQAVTEVARVRARPAPEAREDQQLAGEGNTLRRSGAMERTANEAMMVRAPQNGCKC